MSSSSALLAIFIVVVGIIALVYKLYPTPYPGIPYNVESAKRIAGDIPDLIALIQSSNEPTPSMFAITTRKLGSPIAQILFPGIRKPLIVLDDPREIEDILTSRNKEFDKGPTSIGGLGPMFPHATLSQFATPELKAQKRLWADVMGAEFLRKAAAPNVYKSTLELIELWRLKASTVYKDHPFEAHDDFKNAAIDGIWVAVVGEEPGVMRHEIAKLEQQISGTAALHSDAGLPPRGLFLKKEMAYVCDAFSRNMNNPFPKLASMIETWTPRYRLFRRTVTTEVGVAMRKAVERFRRIEATKADDDEKKTLESDDFDTCMMDLVLRRQLLAAKKAGRPPSDPTKDPSMLDELLTMLFGGHDSTANALAWFVRYMELYPAVQDELRAALRAVFNTNQPPYGDILDTDIPYLSATCEESLRFANVARGNIRQALVDTEILGHKIPKGAEVLLSFSVDHTPVPVDPSKRASGSRAAIDRHGDGFQGSAGRDLSVFEPRRWLTTDNKTGKEVFNPYALPFLAFGGGYRGCTGRKLAMMQFRMVVTLLILNLEFLELPEKYKSMTATEKMFRRPDLAYVRVRVLE
ncbi:cytochrome P450 [Xylariaceae sp. FL0255]|nr:cytochrome P450 [Xylariaceae sp. FL0255]